LQKVTLNKGLITLTYNAFQNCTALTSITIPVTVTSIGEDVFRGCTGLKDVSIQNNLIGRSMFYGCTSLSNIVLPAVISSIESYAFNGCTSLKSAQFLGNVPASFGSYVFDNCNGAFEIQYFDGMTGWTSPTWNGYKTRKITKLSGDVSTIFDDVYAGEWYVSSIQFVYDKGIMTGNTKTEFGTNNSIKRVAVVQALYANEKKPAVSGGKPFTDVNSTDWYYDALRWAKQKGISSGNPDGSFGVKSDISREALATMLYKYAQMKKIKTGKTAGASNGYSDSTKISAYAKDAMDWAVTQGILSGKGTGNKSQMRLDPTGKATRAEFATMLAKLLK
jgi:hypothetical protein